MTTPDNEPVTLDDIDEALHWAALTAARGQHWQEWVDQLLDVRATLSPLPTVHTSQKKTKTKNVKQQHTRDNTNRTQ
jgi:hypothetical protein